VAKNDEEVPKIVKKVIRKCLQSYLNDAKVNKKYAQFTKKQCKRYWKWWKLPKLMKMLDKLWKKVTKNYEKVTENEEDDLQELQENRLVLKNWPTECQKLFYFILINYFYQT